MEIILTMKILYESFLYTKVLGILHFLSRSERYNCFYQHKICYSSIHKDIVVLNKILKDMIVFIFIVETI